MEKSNNAQKYLEEIQNTLKSTLTSGQLKDNKIEFSHNELILRVRKLSNSERMTLESHRLKEYTKLVSEDGFEFEDVLRKKLNEKGKNIEDIEKKVIKLQEEINKKYLILVPEKEEESRQVLRQQILELLQQQESLSETKSNLLAASIEQQLIYIVYGYAIVMCLEVKTNEEWKPYFNNYKEYLDCEDDILTSKSMSNIINLGILGNGY